MYYVLVYRMIQPLCIGGLLAYFNHNANANTTDINLAYFYASSLVIVNLVICFLHRYAQVEMSHCFMTIRVACSSAILNKVRRFFGEKNMHKMPHRVLHGAISFALIKIQKYNQTVFFFLQVLKHLFYLCLVNINIL